jgi:hypothetical protein
MAVYNSSVMSWNSRKITAALLPLLISFLEPVKLYYVLTVNFKVEKGPPPLISNP